MGFFDKVKKVFGSKKEDIESQNSVNDEVIDEPKPNEKIRNFKYLDKLIHSGVKEIVLDSDIVLDPDEESQYLNGIKLDADDLAIDGNGHAIDARGLTRIFYCTGKNIIIKNIILKNGFTKKMLDLNEKLIVCKAPQEEKLLKMQIDNADEQINRMVYELYGLTEDEIAIIEEWCNV